MAELYTRWMQFGIFNPLSRAHHEGNNAVEPWLFGEVAEKNAKTAIELKYQLFPYLYSYAHKAHQTGLPILRGLFMEFPQDDQVIGINDQFMFGQEILVAPVLKKGERVKKLYLPDGEWIDFNDKKTVYLGGQQIAYRAPLNRIPMFVKKGAIVPMMPIMQYIGQDPMPPLYIHIFPNYEGESATFELYEDDGETQDYLKGIGSTTRFTCTTLAEGDFETAIQPRDKGYTPAKGRQLYLCYHLESRPNDVTIDGKTISYAVVDNNRTSTIKNNEPSWTWDAQQGSCIIKLTDDRNAKNIKIH